MYSMIIVDDEPLTLEQLAAVFPWKELGFEVCGCFCCVPDALAYLKTAHTDVIFTDIRLGSELGLTLAKEAKKLDGTTRIVLISAYSEFEYAHEALSISVFDYLLKPISFDKVTDCFNRLRADLDSRRDFSGQDPSAQLFRHIKNGDPASAGNYLELFAQYNSLGSSQLLMIIKELFDILDRESDASSQLPVEEMLAELSACDSASSVIYKAVKQFYLLSSAVTRPDFTSWYVSEAKRYIEQHISDELSLGDIASHISLSPSYLSRIFLKITGEKISNYISHTRIRKAIELLGEPSVKISKLGAMVGYNSRSAFYHLFQRETGYTPAEYRRDVLHIY